MFAAKAFRQSFKRLTDNNSFFFTFEYEPKVVPMLVKMLDYPTPLKWRPEQQQNVKTNMYSVI